MAAVLVEISKINAGGKPYKEYSTPVDGVIDGSIVYLPDGAGSIMINTETKATVNITAAIADIATELSATDLT